MRHLTVSILVTLTVLLGSAGESFALPECPGSPTKSWRIYVSWNNCKGTFTYAIGDKYVGEWKDGNWHGQGTYTYADGSKYVGEYKDNQYHGQGTRTYADGSKYVGEYKDNQYHGQGTYTFADGGKYVGEYRGGLRHGQGTYIYAESGNKYVGEWKDGKKDGQGTKTFGSGGAIEGIWENGQFKSAKKVTPTVTAKKSPPPSKGKSFALPECPGSPKTGSILTVSSWNNCEGTWTHPKGNKYVGEFKDGKPHGQGTYTFASGGKYVGEYKDDKRHGQGTYTTADGEKYVGEWKDDKPHGQGTVSTADGRVKEGVFENGQFKYAQKVSPTVIAKKSPEPSSEVQNENERLRKEIARLKKQNQSKPKQVAKRTPPKKSPPPKSATSGSGFFISKKGHVITNQHIVSDCGKVTVGDNAQRQVTADVLETDRRNDLALLRISSTKMSSVETKSLIRKLGITVVPLASEGLLRAKDVELGEDVLVSGYPYGDIFSNTIKVTKGIVSANRGLGDDTGQFQMDAAVQPGNSGGPIYDENGNIVGVVVAQLNKRKFEKMVGSMPENVNFGIKASTVRQFLTSSGLPTKWSKRSKRMSTKQLAKIAKNQTVMVVCHP